ncbi:MAG: Holliday junction branch migration protein RuvA [Armatimonadetes bacterium]|nr:Holliday junction branch migration protein RuvA [Armatimonadota bacterium]
MISQIRGELAGVGGDSIVVDVNGVGYKAFMPLSEIGRLPGEGEEVRLFVTTYVREDTLALYGFLDAPQRDLFEMLLGVSGVGPRVALAILSVLSTDELLNAIGNEDARVLQRAPGVGLKLAQRLVLELRDRVARVPRAAGIAGATPSDINAASDAVEALQSLGYKQNEASKAVEQAVEAVEDRSDTGKIVRAALRFLTKK